MRQPTLSDNGFEKFRKKTRKEQFLDEMEVIIPWKDLTQAIEPFYPQPEAVGRRPVGVRRLRRRHKRDRLGWARPHGGRGGSRHGRNPPHSAPALIAWQVC